MFCSWHPVIAMVRIDRQIKARLSESEAWRYERVAYLQIALFAVALSRAWALVQGKQASSPTRTGRPADPVTRHSSVHQRDTFRVEIAGTE